MIQEHRQGFVANWARIVEGWGWHVMAAPAVKTKLGGFSGGGVAILWRKWVKVWAVSADLEGGPYPGLYLHLCAHGLGASHVPTLLP